MGNVHICTAEENRTEQSLYLTEETRKRISRAAKARKRSPHSEETKKRISEGNKRAYQRLRDNLKDTTA